MEIEPLEHPACGYLRLITEMQNINQRCLAEELKPQIEKNRAEITSLNEERAKIAHKEEEWVASQRRWSVWAVGSQYLGLASTFALGGAAYATAPVAGMLLTASAVTGLANRALQDSGLYQAFLGWATSSEEKQKSYTLWTDSVLSLLSVGLGVAGGVGAYQAGALSRAANETTAKGVYETLKSTISTASSVVGTVAQGGKLYADWHTHHLQGDLTDIDREITKRNQQIPTDFQYMQRIISSEQEFVENARRAIAQLA